MTKAIISKEAFRKALATSNIRKTGAKAEIRTAIDNMEEGQELVCKIHYQSYKNLQRELLHSGTAYILKAKVEGKNVVKLLVSKDLEIIAEGQKEFQTDAKYKALDTEVVEVEEVTPLAKVVAR